MTQVLQESINFEILRPHWEDLANLGAHAEAYAYSDPQSALIKLRCFAEKLVGVVFARYKIPTYPNESFIDRLNNHSFTSVVDQGIVDKLHAIRKVGNRAAHEGAFSNGLSRSTAAKITLWKAKTSPQNTISNTTTQKKKPRLGFCGVNSWTSYLINNGNIVTFKD